MKKNDLLYNAPLYYPSAKEWMWDYCIYLGPFTDSEGTKYDLGVHITKYFKYKRYSAAIVYGNTPGDYLSGGLSETELTRECYVETVRRCKELNLFQ